jgi:hypothetical protein
VDEQREIEGEPLLLPVKLESRARFLVAVPEQAVTTLPNHAVEETREAIQDERATASEGHSLRTS